MHCLQKHEIADVDDAESGRGERLGWQEWSSAIVSKGSVQALRRGTAVSAPLLADVSTSASLFFLRSPQLAYAQHLSPQLCGDLYIMIRTVFTRNSLGYQAYLECMLALMLAMYVDASKAVLGNALQLHVDLAGVGVSLSTPEVEVLYLLLDGIRSKVTSGKVRRTMELCIRTIQV